jgi:superfamily I DNA/RNA helicase
MCFGGRELDAVFLKNDAVAVIELKNYGGRIHFSENGDWTANEHLVRGGNQTNPFRQVRANKFALLDYLRERETHFTEGVIRPEWGHISGAVVFGQPISFDETLPLQISPWFHICDLSTAATKLDSLRSRHLVLRDDELRQLLGLLELGSKHIYDPAEGVEGHRRTSRLQIIHYKQSEFRAAFLKMQNGGAARTQGAVQLMEIIRQARSGMDVFAELPSETDTRIEHSQIYRLNVAAKLVTVRHENTLRLCYFGDGLDVERWLEANAGLTFSISGTDAKIEPTIVNSEGPMPPASATGANIPYLRRVEDFELDALVPQGLIRKALLRLDEHSTDEDIAEVLEAVDGGDLRCFLRDVLHLTRSGDKAGANARIALRQGEACPVEDAPALAAEALSSGANSEEIVILNELEPSELRRLLDPKRFQDWMLFLHPDQKKVVEADFERPVVLTGVSGSGKTCILVHRARHLARKYPGERIGVLTLNRSLAVLLRNLISELCLEGEDANIHVMAFYDYFSDVLHEVGPETYLDQLSKLVPDSEGAMHEVIANVNRHNLAREFDPRSGESIEDWDDFYDQQHPDFNNWLRDLAKHLEDYRIDTSRYLREEFTLIRSAFAVSERNDGYLTFIRAGRSIALLDDLRRDVLRLLLYYEEWMLHGELLDVPELTQAVLPLWREIRDLPSEKKFRCLLVDEFQDFSTQDLRLLMWVPPRDKENAFFIAGDPVQKIMVKRLNLRDASLVKGSATLVEIRKNYRNSRQILEAASQLANEYGKLAATQGEDIEVLDPELAARETVPPIAFKTSVPIRKAWELALECLESRYSEAWTICIATAATAKVSVNDILAEKPARVEAKVLSGDCINEPDTMVVGQIHDLKGFEFNVVIILGCDHGSFPGSGVPKDERWRDALRLYVAMTRARDQVFLFYSTEPSEFLVQMKNQLLWQEGEVVFDYETAPVAGGKLGAGVGLSAKARKKIKELCEVPPGTRCESWFEEREIDTLNRYFAKFILGKRLPDTATFREWLTPTQLSLVKWDELLQLQNVGRASVQRLSKKLREHGIDLREPR